MQSWYQLCNIFNATLLNDEKFERYIISVNDYYVNPKQNIKFSWVHDKTICSGELGSKIVRVDRKLFNYN